MKRKPRSRVALPEGFLYQPDFVSTAEEAEIMPGIGRLEFGEVRMHGVAARRRVVHFGWLYSFESFRVAEGPAMPEFLLPLRRRAAHVIGTEEAALAEALVTQYPPGASIGWHRDAPPFGTVVALSFGSPCRLRFRREECHAWLSAELEIAPRSLYVLRSEARNRWQHSIPTVKELRYSITFRTLRSGV